VIGLLQQIVDLMVCWIQTGATLVLNALIAALGAALAAVLLLLPNMPDMPEVPETVLEAAGWVAWVFPVDTVVNIFEFMLAAWLIWQVVALALRWAKAI
jgi:hypothetical protein